MSDYTKMIHYILDYLSLWKYVCIVNNISTVSYMIDYTTFAVSGRLSARKPV